MHHHTAHPPVAPLFEAAANLSARPLHLPRLRLRLRQKAKARRAGTGVRTGHHVRIAFPGSASRPTTMLRACADSSTTTSHAPTAAPGARSRLRRATASSVSRATRFRRQILQRRLIDLRAPVRNQTRSGGVVEHRHPPTRSVNAWWTCPLSATPPRLNRHANRPVRRSQRHQPNAARNRPRTRRARTPTPSPTAPTPPTSGGANGAPAAARASTKSAGRPVAAATAPRLLPHRPWHRHDGLRDAFGSGGEVRTVHR